MPAATNPNLRAAAKDVCRALRKSETPAETALWLVLRNRQFHGLKFYRQYPLFVDWQGTETFFVADFFCFENGPEGLGAWGFSSISGEAAAS